MAGCGKPKKEDSELGGGQCALEEQEGGLFRRVAIKSGASTKGGCHGRGACEIKNSNKVVGAQLPPYAPKDKAVVQQLSFRFLGQSSRHSSQGVRVLGRPPGEREQLHAVTQLVRFVGRFELFSTCAPAHHSLNRRRVKRKVKKWRAR